MAITKRTEQDKIEIVGQFKIIQVRTATILEEDGVELTRTFHRHIVKPDADVSGESAEVQAISAAVHTDSVRAAWTEHLEDTSD
jgi:hypothetical protein